MLKKLLTFLLFSLLLITTQVNAEEKLPMNSKRLAQNEMQMWQAYYAKDMQKVFQSMTDMLKIQYNIDNPQALQTVANNFLVAVNKFSNTPQNASQEQYTTEVLPSVQKAYQSLKETAHTQWNANQVATNELEWWVARRQIDTQDPEIVAEKIAKTYASLYGDKGKNFFIRAAYLRAVAARYRDQCQQAWGGTTQQDWQVINVLLEKSYHDLNQGIKANQKS